MRRLYDGYILGSTGGLPLQRIVFTRIIAGLNPAQRHGAGETQSGLRWHGGSLLQKTQIADRPLITIPRFWD